MPTFILPSPHTPVAASTEKYLAAATAIRTKSLDPQEKCCYPSKRCENPRVVKSNGELHRFCDEHRTRANLNQRRLEERRREQQQPQPQPTTILTIVAGPTTVETAATTPAGERQVHTLQLESEQQLRQLQHQHAPQPGAFPSLISIQAYVAQLDRQFAASQRFALAPSQQLSGILEEMDMDDEDLRVLVDVLSETDDTAGDEDSDAQIYQF